MVVTKKIKGKRGRRMARSRKSRVDNFRIEKFTMDTRGDIFSVEVGCYMETSLTKHSNVVRYLNKRLAMKKYELETEYGIEGIKFFWVEVPDTIVDTFAYVTIGVQFIGDGDSRLESILFDTMSENIIQTIQYADKVTVYNK